jgi:glc operon protein GlcG
MRTRIFLLLLLTFFFFASKGQAQTAEGRILTLADAQRIADAAEKRARQDNWTVVIAILDGGGHLVSLRRIDGTQVGSVEVAIAKAKSAVYFKRPTKVFQDAVAQGNHHILSLPNAMPIEGGIPIEHGGRVIGSIGVSGVTSAQDGIIAQAGLKAF